MSKATKKKHVAKEALDEYYVPEGDEEIVKIVGGRGNNLHEVEAADGKKFLASMPTKFRKSLWIKRGDFVIVTPIKEGNKVLAEIVYVLYSKQIKYLQQEGYWPEHFSERHENEVKQTSNGKSRIQQNDVNTEESSDESSGDDDENDLFENPNRPNFIYYEESDSDDEGSVEEFETEEENKIEQTEEKSVCLDDSVNALDNLTLEPNRDNKETAGTNDIR